MAGGRKVGVICALGTLGIWLCSCSAFPKDSADAWQKAQTRGSLRVVAAPEPPWVVTSPDGQAATGIEADLIKAFAERHNLNVQWSFASQLQAVEWLQMRQADVAIAGFEHKSPIEKKAALSQPYVKAKGIDHDPAEHVMAVMPGESRLLFELDRFLLEDPKARSLAAAHGDLP